MPSRENIVAITDGKAYKLSFERFQQFFHQVEAFREWGRSWMVDTIVRQRKRNIAMITATATQRYISLQQEQPEIIQQATLKSIASYLGVTDTSLSRIRSELASPHFPS